MHSAAALNYAVRWAMWGDRGFLSSTTATRLYSRSNVFPWNRLWRYNQSRLQEEECSSDRVYGKKSFLSKESDTL